MKITLLRMVHPKISKINIKGIFIPILLRIKGTERLNFVVLTWEVHSRTRSHENWFYPLMTRCLHCVILFCHIQINATCLKTCIWTGLWNGVQQYKDKFKGVLDKEIPETFDWQQMLDQIRIRTHCRSIIFMHIKFLCSLLGYATDYSQGTIL